MSPHWKLAQLISKDRHMHTRDISVGGRTISIETGRLVKQADGAVVVRSGDTMVLVTACADLNPREGVDFLPLTCDYKENSYASGRIPGGFFKREGKPPEKEVLTSRLIDRPIRPLFPDGWRNETQIIALVLSADTENDTDVLAITGASAALDAQGPMTQARLIPLNTLLADMPAVTLNAEGVRRVAHGNTLAAEHLTGPLADMAGHPEARVLDADGRLLAVAERSAGGLLHPILVLR